MKIKKLINEAKADINNATMASFGDNAVTIARRKEDLARLKVTLKDTLRRVPADADPNDVAALNERITQIDSLLQGKTLGELQKERQDAEKAAKSQSGEQGQDGKGENSADSADGKDGADGNQDNGNSDGQQEQNGQSGEGEQENGTGGLDGGNEGGGQQGQQNGKSGKNGQSKGKSGSQNGKQSDDGEHGEGEQGNGQQNGEQSQGNADSKSDGQNQDGEDGKNDIPDDVDNPFNSTAGKQKPEQGQNGQNGGQNQNHGQNGGQSSQENQQKKGKKKPTVDQLITMLNAELKNDDSKRGAIDALNKLLGTTNESLTEAVRQTVETMTDDEFGDFVNDTLDLIDRMKGKVHIEDDNEITTRINAVKKIQDNPYVRKKIQGEHKTDQQKTAQVKQQTIKARQAEASKYGNFASIDTLEFDIEDLIGQQVKKAKEKRRHYIEDEDNGTISREYEYVELEKEEKPIVDIFFDRSSSWGDGEDADGNRVDSEATKNGKRVINTLNQFADSIVLNIYYFANHVSTSDDPKLIGTGTRAWHEIIQKIKEDSNAANATDTVNNVLLMTDWDMDDQAASSQLTTVTGAVWFVWKNGVYSKNIIDKLQGELGSSSYMFSEK